MAGGAPDEAALGRARHLEAKGRVEEAARAFLAAGVASEAVRVMREAGRVGAAAGMLADGGHFYEAAQCHLEAGEPAAGLDKMLRVGARDSRYREAALEAVRLAGELDALSVRFEHFVGPFIARGPQGDGELDSFYRLGEVYLRHGLPENAEEVFRKIHARAPDYRDVAQRLDAVRDRAPLDESIFAEDGRGRGGRRSGAGTMVVPGPPTGDAAPSPTQHVQAPEAGGAAPAAAFVAGTIVADRYRIAAEIGRGGMATVFRAHDLELSEDVALKLFRPGAHDAEGIARFRQELKVSRRLVHTNITRLYDIGLHRGQRYISMELLVGHSLDDLMAAPWMLRRALDCLIQVCEGLEAAHSQGVIHRDIKPGNLFLTREGLAKIMDFGIARERAAPGVTQAGMIVGTPEYLAPEQIRGDAAAETSDLYALGVVAYEMFTGRRPFVHDDLLPLLQMHLMTPPTPPRRHKPSLPPALEAAILTLLEKDPAKRFPSARALADVLKSIRESPGS